LILSFALADDSHDVKSLTLLRTPKYEVLVPETDRGVHVSLEGDEDLENNLLDSIKLEKESIDISTRRRKYVLNIRHLDESQISEMRKMIDMLNFDSNFQVSDT